MGGPVPYRQNHSFIMKRNKENEYCKHVRHKSNLISYSTNKLLFGHGNWLGWLSWDVEVKHKALQLEKSIWSLFTQKVLQKVQPWAQELSKIIYKKKCKTPSHNLMKVPICIVFLSDPSPIIVYACQSLTDSLTDWRPFGIDVTALLKIEWIDPCWLGYSI